MRLLLLLLVLLSLPACARWPEVRASAAAASLPAEPAERYDYARHAHAQRQLALGNAARAIEGFRQILRHDPQSVPALTGLAAAYDRLERFDISRIYHEQALGLTFNPADRAAYLATLESALEHGRLVQARIMLERAQHSQPQDERLALLRAEFSLAAGQPDKAIPAFQRLLGGKEGARAGQGLGIALLRQGKPAAARQPLEAAVRQNPGLWRAWNALGIAHDQLGRFAEAEAAYAHALSVRPGAAEVLANRGYSRLLQRRPDLALADLQRAAALLPRHETVRTNLQLALALAGLYEAALAEPEAARSNPAAQAQRLNNAGYAALLRGDRPAARALLSRALATRDVYYALAANNLSLLENQKPRP